MIGQSAVSGATRPGGLVESLRQAIASSVGQGHPGIAGTAKAVGLSVRTLQRRLAERGLTYRRVVDQARFEAASHLLAGTDRQLAKIALDLGFADASSFTRAFGRWAGVPPIDFRRNARVALGRGATGQETATQPE